MINKLSIEIGAYTVREDKPNKLYGIYKGEKLIMHKTKWKHATKVAKQLNIAYEEGKSENVNELLYLCKRVKESIDEGYTFSARDYVKDIEKLIKGEVEED